MSTKSKTDSKFSRVFFNDFFKLGSVVTTYISYKIPYILWKSAGAFLLDLKEFQITEYWKTILTKLGVANGPSKILGLAKF